MIPLLYLPLRGEGEGVGYANLLIAFVFIRKPKNIKPIYDLNHRGQCKFPFITGRINMLTSPSFPVKPITKSLVFLMRMVISFLRYGSLSRLAFSECALFARKEYYTLFFL